MKYILAILNIAMWTDNFLRLVDFKQHLYREAGKGINMANKKIILITIALLICMVYAVLVAIFVKVPYNISGTYGMVGMPDGDSINVILKEENFVIYTQGKILEEGTFQPISTEKKNNIYELIDDEQTTVGYIVTDRKQITLLGFEDLSVTLDKVSKTSLYVGFEHNQD